MTDDEILQAARRAKASGMTLKRNNSHSCLLGTVANYSLGNSGGNSYLFAAWFQRPLEWIWGVMDGFDKSCSNVANKESDEYVAGYRFGLKANKKLL